MAINPAADYGHDVACISDADDLFSEVEGIDLLIQDAINAVTSDDFLGEGGDGRGKEIRMVMGAPEDELEGAQVVFAEVVERDERINKCEIVLAPTITNGLADVLLEMHCETDLGPFDFTKPIS